MKINKIGRTERGRTADLHHVKDIHVRRVSYCRIKEMAVKRIAQITRNAHKKIKGLHIGFRSAVFRKSAQRFAIIACLFTALAGCRYQIDKSVLLLGDSLMSLSMVEVNAELLAADDVGIFPMSNAVLGTTFTQPDFGAYWSLSRAPLILAAHPVDEVIISLGTNDSAFQRDAATPLTVAQMTAAAGAFLDAYAGRPVVWILPHAQVRTAFSAGVRYDEVVQAIEAAVAAHPGARTVSFGNYAQAHGAQLVDLCLPGDVHFNSAGKLLWAKMVHDIVAGRF